MSEAYLISENSRVFWLGTVQPGLKEGFIKKVKYN
jgi:hypothetical protein